MNMLKFLKKESFTIWFPKAFINWGINTGFVLSVLSLLLSTGIIPVQWLKYEYGGPNFDAIYTLIMINVMLIIMIIPGIIGGIASKILHKKEKRLWTTIALITLMWIIVFLSLLTLMGAGIVFTDLCGYISHISIALYFITICFLLYYVLWFGLLCRYKFQIRQ